jgi:1,4-alpha-glucan branching enzyme
LTLSPNEINLIIEGKHNNPFGILGLHNNSNQMIARTYIMGAQQVFAFDRFGNELGELQQIHPNGLFEGLVNTDEFQPITYRAVNGLHEWLITCPYTFAPIIGPIDDYLINEGRHLKLFDILGAHIRHHQFYDGVHFAIWAPNAAQVAIVGDFNDWDGRKHIMRARIDTGIWEIFIPNIGAGRIYKYQIHDKAGNLLPLKADPYAFQSELRPNNGSVVTNNQEFEWNDAAHQDYWQKNDARNIPISIYEVHAGSWQRGLVGEFLNWDQLSDTLIPYVLDMGFTHIEFLPISEHPLDESWGYQTTGLYSPTARFGSPAAFARFVNNAHKAGLGIILDWVPAHFPTDSHGLSNFDGTALYEYEDPRLGFHPDWTTFIYNFSRREVLAYLVNNALYWAQKFHIDGLRVDAVASMIYRDYSRKAGEWLPNSEGGRENWEAVNFLQTTNRELRENHHSFLTIAEESTSWPGVTHLGNRQALGFNYKWNMGFMNDTLKYMARDPIHRQYHHNDITFGITYAFSENFVLPLSHDEVVHGKGSLINKMSGDEWQKFANLRAYYAFMWAYPGKKLLFMGQEFAQSREWCEARGLDWHHLDDEKHKGIQNLVRDLNHIYKTRPSLHANDCAPNGFEWVVVNDATNSVFAFLRFSDFDPPILIISNFSGQRIDEYKIPLTIEGNWCEILNSDSEIYGGTNCGNLGKRKCEKGVLHLTLPSLSTIIFEFNK